MKWREFKRIAESNGWVLKRNGASHDIYIHPKYEGPMQIERHWSKEIKPGLLRKLMKQVEGK